MRTWAIWGCLFFFACGTEPEKPVVATQQPDTVLASVADNPVDSDIHSVKDTTTEELPLVPATKKPSGLYRTLMPVGDDEQMLQTVAFYPTTYRLQEEYSKRDSTVVTEGTWAPTEGTIWLYKDQILRGRYTWKSDTLQYYSPRLKKYFSMEKLQPATTNNVWQTKRREGALLYGVGTEPFWSVEVSKQDSIVVNMPDWESPLQAKITSSDSERDSTIYAAAGDSLHLTVYPLFCNDGMSDFVYTRRVKLVYKGKTFRGCGEMLRRNP